jgi:uncharacterized membrane protein YphA (DoxX/SURF4 family)
MDISLELDRLHHQAKESRWLWYFAIFNRIALAVGFIIAGLVKIMGERFASGLSTNHPMGHYLEALFHTGYYYTFIGVLQVLAAILLLLPRTATLGAVLYFPIILNICILSFAVRFEGSLLSAPLMTLANLYLLCWDYDKLKPILPFSRPAFATATPTQLRLNKKFPVRFFAGVLATIVVLVLLVNSYKITPRNSFADCQKQFKGTSRTQAGYNFCTCIHKQGKPLAESLDAYDEAPDDNSTTSLKP